MKELVSVNKPKGPSSNQFLGQIRKLLNTKKIGHAGTLDPLASGVLVIGVGREATRQLSLALDSEKEYVAEIYLGKNSSTDDEEGEKTAICKVSDLNIKKEDIEKVLTKFIGLIWQEPPIYSALKIKGIPAYKLARQGKIKKLASREVEIKKIELITYFSPIIKLKVICSKGVYIRSLARDIGRELSVGAYLSNLERTRVGEFTIKTSLSLNKLKEKYLAELSEESVK